MFNRKSSYALNKKDPNAIVYMDANEAIIRLTREDFASEEEFLKWKSLSDADYHASEKEDHVYANHTVTTLFPTAFQLLPQTAHVRFHERKWVHTRLSEKDCTQGLTRRNRSLPFCDHSAALCRQ